MQGVKFRELKPALSDETVAVLDSLGFSIATPVQAASVPLLCNYQDVAVDAATGSGKTLAFVLPIVEIFRRMVEPLKPFQVGAMIVSPTRELASQIFQVAQPFMATLANIKAALLVGGTDVAADLLSIKENGANVLVGTPGRLEDVLERSAFLDIRSFEVLILDEADRLLDMGFKQQISALIKRLPKQRRTGLFSATQTQAVEELAKAGLRNPVRVEVRIEARAFSGADNQGSICPKTPISLCIQYAFCEADKKPSRLVQFLGMHSTSKTIVYFMTCACVDYWGTVLPKLMAMKGVTILMLHGKMKQAAREKALGAFSEIEACALFCTDVAARGLDIPGVDWIIQYDPPQDPNVFVHRVGRTARMGRSGNALVFLLPQEDSYVEFLRIRRVPIEEDLSTSSISDVVPQLRATAKEDRDVMEKGVKAFVSYVRAYKEHQCTFIFRWKELELGKVAMGYGLLQLPAMPELRRGVLSAAHFIPLEGVDIHSIKFKDKAREKQRQRKLAAKLPAVEPHGALSRVGRPSVKGMHTPGIHTPDLKKKKDSKRRRAIRVKQDEEEMDGDYRLLRKLKKGLISEEEFDKAISSVEVEVSKASPSNPLSIDSSKRKKKKSKYRP